MPTMPTQSQRNGVSCDNRTSWQASFDAVPMAALASTFVLEDTQAKPIVDGDYRSWSGGWKV